MSPASRRALRAVAMLGLVTGCSLPETPAPPPVRGTSPDDPSVERVVFLVGDAGASPSGSSPLLLHVGEEVERWSAALAADSAVTVLFLGDNVYPDGVHGRAHPERTRDSIRLTNQMDVVSGPMARRYDSPGIFLPGNHDWGGRDDAEGEALVRNQEELIQEAAERGVPVDLMPPAVDPGPEVLDLGEHMKLVSIDTQWWLARRGTLRHDQALQQLKRALREPAGRFVLVAAHHPLATGASHGGYIPLSRNLGLNKLLHLAGVNGQNLTALPYQAMIRDVREAVAGTEATVIYAAGHSHALEVIRGTDPADPEWILVSGSGSNGSPVRDTEGTRLRTSARGYMRLIVTGGGGLLLEVVAETEEGFQPVWTHRIR